MSETSEHEKYRHGSGLSILSMKPQSETVMNALKAIAVWEDQGSGSSASIEAGVQDIAGWSSRDGSVFQIQVV